MKRTTVDGRLLVDGSSNSRKSTFSLEDFVNGTQSDSRTSTSFASSKIVCPQISRKPQDKELANDENKQFDPGGKGEETAALKSGCTGIYFL